MVKCLDDNHFCLFIFRAKKTQKTIRLCIKYRFIFICCGYHNKWRLFFLLPCICWLYECVSDVWFLSDSVCVSSVLFGYGNLGNGGTAKSQWWFIIVCDTVTVVLLFGWWRADFIFCVRRENGMNYEYSQYFEEAEVNIVVSADCLGTTTT